MILRHLTLQNFRNYIRFSNDLPAGPLLVVGGNAQGKTSLLEAVYYLATASTPHATSDRQLINFAAPREPVAVARLVGDVVTPAQVRRIEIRLIEEPSGPIDTRFRKEILIDGIKRRAVDLAGQFNAVMFLPQDMRVLEGSPGDRRRYLDDALGQVDPAYAHALSEYGKILAQRNALLKQLNEGGSPGQLDFWDEQLAEFGARVIARRALAIAELERFAVPVHRSLTRGAETLRLSYRPAYDPVTAPEGQLALALDVAVDRTGIAVAEVQSGMLVRLRELRGEEIGRGQTTVGPHRDELRFLSNGLDLATYGSRGQGRTAVLSLKLAEMEWMKAMTGEWPVLLLDEALAELDHERRADLLARIGGADQSLLATTDLDLFSDEFKRGATVWRIVSGTVEESDEGQTA